MRRGGWTAARRAKFQATIARKKGTEIPLEHIPDRLPQIKMNGHPVEVYAEYDTSQDQMMLVMGKLRLPLRVK